MYSSPNKIISDNAYSCNLGKFDMSSEPLLQNKRFTNVSKLHETVIRKQFHITERKRSVYLFHTAVQICNIIKYMNTEQDGFGLLYYCRLANSLFERQVVTAAYLSYE